MASKNITVIEEPEVVEAVAAPPDPQAQAEAEAQMAVPVEEARPASAIDQTDTPLVRPATPEETALVTRKFDFPDFIETYVEYADVLEAPRQMHETVAMQLLATILNRNGVSIPLGPLYYSLDLWTLLLSQSGGGRSTLIEMAQPVLEQAGLDDLVLNVRWGSPQALYQQMADRPAGLFKWGEFSEKMKQLDEKYFAGAKAWLTDRYDSWRKPETTTYRSTGKKSKDTPAITFSCPPRINILSTSSEAWFFSNLAYEDSTGGFIPRWMLVRPKFPGKIIPIPRTLDLELAKTLAIQLLYVDDLEGEVDLTNIIPEYEKWYVTKRRQFQSAQDPDLAIAYFNRHKGHILKLATLYEVSSTLSLKVTRASWERAVATAAELEETIHSLLRMGMNKEGHALERKRELIHSAGANGLPWSTFVRAFQRESTANRRQALITLVDGQQVAAFQRRTAGKTGLHLVHADFGRRYVENHTEDRLVAREWLVRNL